MLISELLQTRGLPVTTGKVNGLTGADMTWSTTGEVSKEPKGMVIKGGVYAGM